MAADNRLHYFDNVKAALISIVVLGHVFELVVSRKAGVALSFMYMFHMPLFVFCLGYFAKFNPKKVILNLGGTYLLFQTLFFLLQRFVFGYYSLRLQFTTPHWVMWFLLAMIIWMLLVPLLDIAATGNKRIAITIGAAFLLGILAGFDDNLGHFMSLGRVVYFFPFFVLGFCVKKAVDPLEFLHRITHWRIRILTGVPTALIFGWLWFNNHLVDIRWLWGVHSYYRLDYTGYNFVVRIMLYIGAMVISLFFLSVIPVGKMFFSYIGTRTLQVFLLHGFVVHMLNQWVMRHIPGGFVMLGFTVAVTAAMVFLFSAWVFVPSEWVKFYRGLWNVNITEVTR